MRKNRLCLWLSCLILLSTGCALCPPHYEYRHPDVPSWIYELPREKGWIYVWGSAGHSLSLEETKKFARENAKRTLAYFLGVQVKQKKTKWELFAPGVTTKLEPKVNWKSLSVKVVDEWFDPEGKAGLGYQYFVLIRMKR